MNPLKKLLGQTAIYGLSSIVGRLLNFLLVPIYTRYFSPSAYGEVTLLYAYVAFFVVLLVYGMETSFFRFSQNQEDSKKVFNTSLISVSVSSVIFVGLTCLFSQPIANFLQFGQNPEYIIYFVLILGMDAVSSLSFAKLRLQNRAFRFAFVRLLNIFTNIGLNLLFIVYCPYAIENQLFGSSFLEQIYSPNFGIAYIFIANLVSSALMLLMLSPQMYGCFNSFDKEVWHKMLRYGLPLMLAGLAGVANETIDRIILQFLLPSDVAISEIGLYSAFYKLSIIMTLFVQAFRFGAEPFFFAQAKEKNAKTMYAQVLNYFVIVTSFIFLATMIYFDVVKHFIHHSFHDDRAVIVVPILLLANLFLGIYYNLSVWYKLSNRTKYGAYLSGFGALITIVFNLLLIPQFGFVGAAWATLICYFSMTVASYFLSKKYYAINYPTFKIITYLLLAIAFYMLSLFVNLGMGLNSVYLLLFLFFAYVLERSKKSIIFKT